MAINFPDNRDQLVPPQPSGDIQTGDVYVYQGTTYTATVLNNGAVRWDAAVSAGSDAYVLKVGDTMTGQLTLPGGGTGSEAATVDQITSAIPAALWQRDGGTSTLSPATANDNLNQGSGNITTTGNLGAADGTFSGVLKVDGQSGGSRLYEGTGAFADSLVIDGAPIQGASGSIVFTTNSVEAVRIKGDGTADFKNGKVQILPNGALIAIRDAVADATYGKVTLNGGFSNGTRVPFLAQGNVGGTVKETFAVESSGTTKIGGTLPDSPNITLNANGDISNFFPSGNPFCTIKASTKKLTLNGTVADGMNSGTIVFATSWAGSEAIQLAAGGTANKPGGGSWGTTSDKRVKEGIADYATSLAELRQLTPRSYRYIGNPNTYIGLVAQEAEAAMPELVTKGEGKLPDGTEVDDFRHLDQTPLTFALINAVKEMATRIEALEAEVQSLKGGSN